MLTAPVAGVLLPDGATWRLYCARYGVGWLVDAVAPPVCFTSSPRLALVAFAASAQLTSVPMGRPAGRAVA
ncbi:hypothetical protein [Salinispora arenicola]|uniref:hypothetical protein n=1 Tax=Salinispora arenicola TaxID=168697 RepID=UPI0012BB9497|nr:hypothetical protein [Salinispora arenicola]